MHIFQKVLWYSLPVEILGIGAMIQKKKKNLNSLDEKFASLEVGIIFSKPLEQNLETSIILHFKKIVSVFKYFSKKIKTKITNFFKMFSDNHLIPTIIPTIG